MYNYNTVDGKIDRIKELSSLVSKIGDIPGNYLSYLEARAISQYLLDIKHDLESQCASEIARRKNIKRYRYYYKAEDILILANDGAEADRKFKMLTGGSEPAGNIELTDLVTGEKSIIMKIDIGVPVNF